MRRFNKLAIIVIIITFASSVIPISCKKMDETKIENVVLVKKHFRMLQPQEAILQVLLLIQILLKLQTKPMNFWIFWIK